MAKRKSSFYQPFISLGDELSQRHGVYVDEYVHKANDVLYALLGDVLQFAMDIFQTGDAEVVVENLRKTLRTKHNIKTQKNTPQLTVIVRYVVRTSRKTAHVYSKALQVAIDNNVSPADLPEFIKQHGGIDRLRNGIVTAEVKEQQAAGRANLKNLYKAMTTALLTRNIGTVKFREEHFGYAAVAADVEFTYLLCVRDPATGETKVAASCYPSSAVEQNALDATLAVTHAATLAERGGKEFWQYCKDQGLNQDQVCRWMKSNDLNDKAKLHEFYKMISQLKKAYALEPAEQFEQVSQIYASAIKKAA